jgi:predicted metalloendopeptidase
LPQLSISSIVLGLSPSDYKPDKLIVAAPAYLKSVSQILSNTSRETIQGYFEWKVIARLAGRVDPALVKPLTSFRNTLQGKDPEAVEERWRTCVSETDGGVGWILSRFFVEKAFSESAKVLGDQVVSDIKEQFINKLNVIDWMSKDVVKLAIDKGGSSLTSDRILHGHIFPQHASPSRWRFGDVRHICTFHLVSENRPYIFIMKRNGLSDHRDLLTVYV